MTGASDHHHASDAAPIPLAEDVSETLPPRRLPCRACGEMIGIDEAVCPACGRDRRIRAAPGDADHADADHSDGDGEPDDPVCAACGYSLRGLRTDRCPECGAVGGTTPRSSGGVLADANCPHCGASVGGVAFGRCPECREVMGERTPLHRRQALIDDARGSNRRAFTVLVSSAIIVGLLSLAALGPVGPILWSIQLGAETGVVLLVFVMAWIMGLDVDESFGGVALRVLAAVAASHVALYLLAFFPILLFAWVASALAFLGFMAYLFEMDWGELMLVGFFCLIAKLVVGVALFLILSGLV